MALGLSRTTGQFNVSEDARRRLNTRPTRQTPLESFQSQAAQPAQEERERAKALIGEHFGEARNILSSSRDVGRENLEEELARRASVTGGSSAARDKIRTKALTSLERGFGQEAAGLSAQEAAALQQAEEGVLNRQFGREQLAAQQEQFAQTLALQQAEFRENLRTNFINTAIALHDSGLQTARDWERLLADGFGFLGEFSPGLAPSIRPTGSGGRDRLQDFQGDISFS